MATFKGALIKISSFFFTFSLPSLQPLKENQFVIPKSRYDSIDCFLANAEYNDIEVLYDKDLFQELKDEGRWQEGGGEKRDKDTNIW